MQLFPRDFDNIFNTVEGYFDPQLNITWKTDIFSEQEYGFPNWRLPTLDPGNPESTSNELFHLFYTTLNNPSNNTSSLNTGPFVFPAKTFPIETDHQNWDFIFATNVLTDPDNIEGGHWIFSFETGTSYPTTSDYGNYIHWQVHDGDIGTHVPAPSSLILFITGILFMRIFSFYCSLKNSNLATRFSSLFCFNAFANSKLSLF